jgi:hypothetical protein
MLVIGCGMWGCEKAASYPDTPEIHFKGLEVKIDGADPLGEKIKSAYLSFSFIDGDGDLGVRDVNSRDTVSKIHYTWMKKLDDGTYEPYVYETGITTDAIRIPYDEDVMNKDEAHNKFLKGTMDIKLTIPYGSSIAGMDTIRIEFFIVDRADHKSNVDITPDFSILADSVKVSR